MFTRAEIGEIEVGKKVLQWLDGKDVEDAHHHTPKEFDLTAERIFLKGPFGQVSAELRGKQYHLAYIATNGGAKEVTKNRRNALLLFLGTAWNVIIRGVIV